MTGVDVTSARRRGDRGSAAVEFALVLPLVLTVALALVQIGLVVKDQLVVEGAARAGAREAAVSRDDARVREAAGDAAVGLRPDYVDVSIHREGEVGTGVTVSVVYKAPVVVPLVRWLFPSPFDLSATVTMRQET